MTDKLPPLRMIFSLCLTAILAACGNGESGRPKSEPLVTVAAVTEQRFVEEIEAVGTALANEQATLAAPVTERVVRINFADGGYVPAGAVLATLAQGQENAQLAEAGARAREARQQLQRLEALKSRGFATNAAVDAQTAAAQAALAQAEQARASMGDRVIRAPFGGYVSLRTVSPGTVVAAGTEIATISDISRIKLDFSIPETLISTLRVGQQIDAIAAAFPDRRFEGRVSSVDPVVDPDTRSVKVRAILPNPDRTLRPGMLMTVAVHARARSAAAVPELALVAQGESSFVYVLQPDGTVKRTAVKTGIRQNGLVEIREGLRPGIQIVTEGVVKLADGMKVRTGKAGATAAPASKS